MNKRLIHLLASCFALLLMTENVSGSGASGHLAEHLQPDGTRVSLRNAGGEWYHWHENGEGYTVVKDADGIWKYARPRPGAVELESIRGAVVGKVNPAALGLKKRELPTPDLIREHIRKLRGSEPGASLTPDPGGPAAEAAAASAPSGNEAAAVLEGGSADAISLGTRTVRCIVILAAFSDHWNTGSNTVLSSKGRPASEYGPLFNQTGYNLNGAAGSVRDFYLENSYGRLTVDATIKGWVKLPQTEAWYGDNANEVSGAVRVRQMALDAVNAAEAASFNFTQGDGDGDGYVDLVHIIHSGHSEAWNGNPSTSIWPLKWSLPAAPVYLDGVAMSGFSCSAALRGGAATSISLSHIGEICHELGHHFGLPDLYDLGGQTQGIGTWCAMGFGNWGATSGGDARRPVHFSAHCKHMLGFVQPKLMHTQASAALPAVETTPEIHLIRDGSPAEHEYFLVENRQPTGFDAELPAGGLLIWHIKQDAGRNHTGEYSNPAVRLEEASGSNYLSFDRYAAAVQPWHSGNALAGGFRDNTFDPDCNAMVYQAGSQYNRTPNAASLTRIRLSNFSTSGATMRYDLQTVVPTVAAQTVATPGYTVTWAAASDASQYELQESVSPSQSSFIDNADNGHAFFENWSTTGLARRSTGGAKTGSGSYMLASKNEANDRWLSHVQSMELRHPFTITSETLLTFWVKSHVTTGRGFLRVELSKNGGVTWVPLEQVSGYVDPWSQRSYGIGQLNAKGFVAGDSCRLRFLVHIQDIYGWSGYPNFGFAIDDISLSAVQIPGYGNWATIGSSITGTSYVVNGKSGGTYAYRARARVSGAWQPWSPASLVERSPSGFETAMQNLPAGERSETGDGDRDGVFNVIEYALARDAASADAANGASQLPTIGQIGPVGGERLALLVDLPEPARSELVYRVEAADVPGGPWNTIATKAGSGAWSGAAVVVSGLVNNGRRTHTVQDVVTINGALQARRFLKLVITY